MITIAQAVRLEMRRSAILLPMQGNSAQDWQELAERYREMSDGELEELAFDFADLTETAQQVLRSELSKRRLELPPTGAESPTNSDRPAVPQWDRPAIPEPDDIESNADGGNEEDDLPRPARYPGIGHGTEDGPARNSPWQRNTSNRHAGPSGTSSPDSPRPRRSRKASTASSSTPTARFDLPR